MLQRTITCSISSPTNHYPPHPIWRLTMSNKKSKLDTAADLQVEARDFAQKSVDQAQKAFENATHVAHDNAQVLEAVTSAYSSGVVDFQKKAVEFTQKNMEQAFAFSRSLFSVKEFNEAISLQQSFLKDQTEVMKSQATELSEIAVRLSSEAAKPLQDSIKKSFEGFSKSFAA